MKNKFIRLISSILVLAFLLSCFAVLSFADDSAAAPEDGAEDTNEDVTLLINRTFDEGWNALNGFTSGIKTQSFDIEYEETKEFLYNYYCRVLANNTVDGYLELRYGTNAADYGPTILELDLRTDDYNNLGKILYGRAPGGNNGQIINLASIENNELKLISPGTATVSAKADDSNSITYNVGSLAGDWVHVAFVYTVNQRRCPSCGTIHDLNADIVDSQVICCGTEEEDGTVSGTTVAKMDKVVSLRVYFGYSASFDMTGAIEASSKSKENKDLTATYYYDVVLDSIANIDIHRLGIPSASGIVGQSYCLDNVKLYNGSATSVKFGAEEYGKNVSTAVAKTVEILSAGASKTTMQYVNSGLIMKVGSDWALSAGKKISIMEKDGVAYGAPVKVDGEVFVSLQAVLDWVGYPMFKHDDNLSFDISTESGSTFVTIGRPTATAGGEVIELSAAPGMATDPTTGEQYIVVALADVEKLFNGYQVTYDDMGLIIITEQTGVEGNILNRGSDLDIMLDLMKSFIFDVATGDEIYDTVKANTNNFQHPYILANAEKFAALKAAYAAVEGDENYDAALKAYLTVIMIEADTIYGRYSNADPAASEGKYLAADIVNPEVEEDENGGYDRYNGRLDAIVTYATELRLLALASQITGDAKYACLGYEFALSLAKWEHWGPAYITNTADAVSAYAMAYDWFYNAWVELGFDVSLIEQAIYTNGIYEGYRSSTGLDCDHPSNQSEKDNSTTKYNTDASSRNAGVTSGMVVASLAIIGSEWLTETENIVNVKWLIENNIKTLIANGLDAYAPDGSFAESPSYWNYSTNGLYTMIWALNTSYGSDMGLSTTWGLDKTFYYAIQTEFKVFGEEGYKYWGYHEAAAGYQNTDMFFYAATLLGDNGVAAVRVEQLNKKPVSVFDLLAYDAAFIAAELPTLELDYRLESVEGFVTRSDWADGSIILGVMGGSNDSLNGQIDSGNFIYTSQGYNWFVDLGGENLGVANLHNADYRYGYYKNNAEGNNVFYVTSENSLAYGQSLTGTGVITDYVTNEYGMYAIIDNNEAYGSIVNSAHRAILFTNDRNTVVIQDEVNFKLVYSSVWVAHTTAEYMQVSEDGRTAYLRQPVGDGTHVWIRVSLVSENKTMKFETMKAYDFMLSKTYAQTFSTTLGGEAEDDRGFDNTGLQKLVINHKNSLSFQAAIVIEVIEDDFSELPVQYNWTAISDWNKDAPIIQESYNAVVEDKGTLPTANIVDIKTFTEMAGKYIDNGYAFSTRLSDFFYAMRIVAHNVKTYEPSGMIQEIKEVYSAYLDYQNYLAQFELFYDYLTERLDETYPIARYLCGYN